MMPNFLVIGAAKAGTTSLYQYLCQHPQIYMSPHKEPRFFALEGRHLAFNGPGDMTRFHFVQNKEQYESLFQGVKNELAIGEVSPWYLYVEQAPLKIKEHIPHAKLIAILRDPVDRAYSNFLHARREQLEPLDDFAEAMEAEEERIKNNWSYRWHYKQKGFYYNQIRRYMDIFPSKNIKIYLYEDFCENPKKILNDIGTFLNVDAAVAWDTQQRYNSAGSPRSRLVADVLKRTRRFAPLLAGNESMRRLSRRTKNFLTSLNTAPAPRLPATARARFVDEYREDILRLQDLLGRDLSSWLRV
jgi:hypothetical protein